MDSYWQRRASLSQSKSIDLRDKEQPVPENRDSRRDARNRISMATPPTTSSAAAGTTSAAAGTTAASVTGTMGATATTPVPARTRTPRAPAPTGMLGAIPIPTPRAPAPVRATVIPGPTGDQLVSVQAVVAATLQALRNPGTLSTAGGTPGAGLGATPGGVPATPASTPGIGTPAAPASAPTGGTGTPLGASGSGTLAVAGTSTGVRMPGVGMTGAPAPGPAGPGEGAC